MGSPYTPTVTHHRWSVAVTFFLPLATASNHTQSWMDLATYTKNNSQALTAFVWTIMLTAVMLLVGVFVNEQSQRNLSPLRGPNGKPRRRWVDPAKFYETKRRQEEENERASSTTMHVWQAIFLAVWPFGRTNSEKTWCAAAGDAREATKRGGDPM